MISDIEKERGQREREREREREIQITKERGEEAQITKERVGRDIDNERETSFIYGSNGNSTW